MDEGEARTLTLKDSRTLDDEDSLFRFFRLAGSEADAGAVEGFPYVAEHLGLLMHPCLTSASEGYPWVFTRGLGEVPAVRVLDGSLSSRRADAPRPRRALLHSA